MKWIKKKENRTEQTDKTSKNHKLSWIEFTNISGKNMSLERKEGEGKEKYIKTIVGEKEFEKETKNRANVNKQRQTRGGKTEEEEEIIKGGHEGRKSEELRSEKRK